MQLSVTGDLCHTQNHGLNKVHARLHWTVRRRSMTSTITILACTNVQGGSVCMVCKHIRTQTLASITMTTALPVIHSKGSYIAGN